MIQYKMWGAADPDIITVNGASGSMVLAQGGLAISYGFVMAAAPVTGNRGSHFDISSTLVLPSEFRCIAVTAPRAFAVRVNRPGATGAMNAFPTQMKERWRILQDTERRISEIQADITTKQNVQDKAYKRWDKYIRDA